MKKILLTGASGSLGGKLCHALFQLGHPVRVLVRRTSDLSSLPPPTDAAAAAIEIVYGDVTDFQSLLAACSGCHVIFHVAAVVEPWLPDPSKFFSVSSFSISSRFFFLYIYISKQTFNSTRWLSC